MSTQPRHQGLLSLSDILPSHNHKETKGPKDEVKSTR